MSYKNRRKGSTVKRYKAPTKKNPAPLKRQKQAATRALANMRTGGYVGLERKFFDTLSSDTLASGFYPANLVQTRRTNAAWPAGGDTGKALFCPEVGSAQNMRDGRVASLSSVYSTVDLSLNTPAVGVDLNILPTRNCRVYVALVHDSQCNGEAFTTADVFNTGSGLHIERMHPLRNLSNVQRFNVLDSKIVNLSLQSYSATSDTTAFSAGSKQSVILYKGFGNGLQVHFKGDDLQISDLSDHNVSLVAFVVDDWATQNGFTVTLQASTRCRFRG